MIGPTISSPPALLSTVPLVSGAKVDNFTMNVTRLTPSSFFGREAGNEANYGFHIWCLHNLYSKFLFHIACFVLDDDPCDC